MTVNSYRIPECNLSELHIQVARLNLKATKLGLDKIVVTEGQEEFETILRCRRASHEGCLHGTTPVGPFDTDFKTVRFVNIEVSGLAPKISGWTFIATIEHEATGNIIRRVPGTEETPIHNSYRTAPAACHHCHQTRNRKDTYLLVDEQGQVIEVGHNCLKDFLGHKDPHAIASFLEALNALEIYITQRDDEELIHRSPEYTYTEDFLGHVAAIIRTKGWLSGGKARETGQASTAGLAANNLYLTRHPQTNKYGEQIAIKVSAEDKALATASLAWGRALATKENKSDYEHNLWVAVSSDKLEGRNQGIVASVVNAYKRATEEKVEREVKVEKPESNWVGTVGKREVFELTVERLYERSSDFGPQTIVNFADDQGDKLVWFATGIQNLKVGETVSVKGSVKAHNTNQRFGYKETVLTRCSVS